MTSQQSLCIPSAQGRYKTGKGPSVATPAGICATLLFCGILGALAWCIALGEHELFPNDLIVVHALIIVPLFISEILRHRTVVTPLTIFGLMYTVIVILPLMLNDSQYNHDRLIRGDEVAGTQAFVVLASVALFVHFAARRFGGRKRPLSIAPPRYDVRRFWMIAFFWSALATVVHLASLITLGGFGMLGFIIDPRSTFAATQISGANWAMPLRSAIYAVFVAIVVVAQRRSLTSREKASSWIYTAAYVATSGAKNTMFLPLVSMAVVYLFYLGARVNRTIVTIVLAASIAVAIPLSFVWRDKVEANSVSKALVGYNMVFRYTARAVNNIEPDVAYLGSALYSLVISPVPRAMWHDKPSVSLSRNVLDYEFYHSTQLPDVRPYSTMGLAEIWISLGWVGIVITGVVFGVLLAVASAGLSDGRSLPWVLTAVVICESLYFILRVGIIDFYMVSFVFSLWIVYVFGRLSVVGGGKVAARGSSAGRSVSQVGGVRQGRPAEQLVGVRSHVSRSGATSTGGGLGSG